MKVWLLLSVIVGSTVVNAGGFLVPGPVGTPGTMTVAGDLTIQRNAFYVVQPYFGYVQAECSARFEAETGWPAGSLIAPVRGTSLQPLLLRDGCTVAPQPRPAPAARRKR